MNAILLTALFAAGQDRPAPSQPPAGGDKPAMAASIDGNWTILSVEKNGQPVAEAKDVRVSVRDNVVTFTAPGGAPDKAKMKALKVSFGQNGTIRVMEANADGKFENTGTGTAPPAGAGTGKEGGTNPPAAGAAGGQPGGTTAGGRPGTGAGSSGSATAGGAKSGVYILTQDFLAICLHDDSAGGTGGANPGARPGGTDPGARPGGQPGTTPPAGGTGATPGAGGQPGGTGAQPGGTGGAGAQPGAGAGADMRPNSKTYMTVILKRADGGARPGDTPKRDKD